MFLIVARVSFVQIPIRRIHNVMILPNPLYVRSHMRPIISSSRASYSHVYMAFTYARRAARIAAHTHTHVPRVHLQTNANPMVVPRAHDKSRRRVWSIKRWPLFFIFHSFVELLISKAAFPCTGDITRAEACNGKIRSERSASEYILKWFFEGRAANTR